MYYNVKITGFSNDYKGVSIVNGKKCFVPYTVVGDVVNIGIVENKAKYIIAKVINYVEKSKFRNEEKMCKYFEKCGGCPLYFCEDNYYYDIKKKKLINCIESSGFKYNENKLEIFKVGFGKRRRINLKYKNGVYGFYKKNSNDIISIKSCINVSKNINKTIELFENLSFKNLDSIDVFDTTYTINISLIFNGEPKIEEFKQLDIFKNQNYIISYTYKEKGGYIPIIGSMDDVMLNLDNLQINLPQNCFLQATKESQDFMIDYIKKEIQNITVNSSNYSLKIADLYCGIGTYSFPLANFCNDYKISAFEGSISMVENMKKNIASNNIKNIVAKQRDLFNQSLSRTELNEFDIIIINPPRNGAETQCKNIVKSNVRKVIYVSCNPQSLARDLKLFRESDFKLENIVMIDQFYLSEHLESIVVLNNNSNLE